MKIAGTYDEIPGHWFDDPGSPDGKRFVASHYGWDKIRERVKQKAKYRCEQCRKRTLWLHVHHVRHRKMGGGSRDDRMEVNGIQQLVALCMDCHTTEHQ